MATRRNGETLRQLRTLFDVGTVRGLTDGRLLDWFATREREAAELAFAALVERHGPMVLRVCGRVLTDPDDAQDAFQATFLVLVRRASSVRRRESVASWLHGVALRVAGCARKAEARRRRHERRASDRATCTDDSAGAGVDGDLGAVLHEELARLPERLREPIVLCHLEGQSCEEAARRLGWPVGTVKSRLARGRERLRGRLTRRGLAPTVGAVVTALAAGQARASVPTALAGRTATAAVAGYRAAAAGVVPGAVAELTEGVLRSMFLNHLTRAAAGALLAVGIGVAGAAALARPQGGAPAASVPRERSMLTTPPYVVEPPDLIQVDVLEALPGRPLTGERLVQPDGRVNLGYYGEVYVAGLTPKEIKGKVVRHLRKYLTERQVGLLAPDPNRPDRLNPVAAEDSAAVSVTVVAYNSKVYYVQGLVAAPGRMLITGNETVLDAINFAGGLLPTAGTPDVRLIRIAGPGGEPERVLKPDLTAIVHKGDATTNYQIRNGDRLVVSHRAHAGADPEGAATARAAVELKALELRVRELERKLDRVTELLEKGRPAPAAKDADRPGAGSQ